MKLNFNFQKIKRKLASFISGLPDLLVRKAFIFYLVIFIMEVLVGFLIYHHYFFPDISITDKSQVKLDEELINEAVGRLKEEEEQLKALEGKEEYFNLIELPVREESPEDQVD